MRTVRFVLIRHTVLRIPIIQMVCGVDMPVVEEFEWYSGPYKKKSSHYVIKPTVNHPFLRGVRRRETMLVRSGLAGGAIEVG